MMSAEVENNKEEVMQKPKRSTKELIREYLSIGFKLLELLLSCICMGLAYEPIYRAKTGLTEIHHIGLMYTSFTGSMVINCILLIGRAIGDSIPYRTAAIFPFVQFILFLTTGINMTADRAFLMKNFQYEPLMYLQVMLTISILFTFLNCIIFAIDSVITFRWQRDF